MRNTLAGLPTPALLLDRDALTHNISTMAGWARGRVALRPHAKTHKCVEIALMQQEAGAIGATAATVWEVRGLARGGVREILLANELVDPAKADVLADAARSARVMAAVDDPRQVDLLADAAARAKVRLGVLVDVDVGMGRGGVRSTEEGLGLARRVAAQRVLELRGVMGYEGHAVLERDRSTRARLVAAAGARLSAHAENLRAAGLPVDIVSAGGTNTHDLTAIDPHVTELQVGTYAVMDLAYATYAGGFRPALHVLGTVVSRHGRRVVLDCGTKVLAPTDLADPLVNAPGLTLHELHEEHALLDVTAGPGPAHGDRLAISVPYAGGTVNLHDRYHVVQGDRVLETWDVLGRGPGPA